MITTQDARVAASSTAVGALVAVLALQGVNLVHGAIDRAAVPAITPAAQQLIEQQEAAGLRCRVEPALTDRVVVQRAADWAQVVTFELAVEATRTGAGVIARYCF